MLTVEQSKLLYMNKKYILPIPYGNIWKSKYSCGKYFYCKYLVYILTCVRCVFVRVNNISSTILRYSYTFIKSTSCNFIVHCFSFFFEHTKTSLISIPSLIFQTTFAYNINCNQKNSTKKVYSMCLYVGKQWKIVGKNM